MQELSQEDVNKIIEVIQARHGYDFSKYAMSSFRRRILRMLELRRMSPAVLLTRLTKETEFVHAFLNELTVNVTEMFRDSEFWRTLRTDVIPKLLASRSRLSIWHAGCSTGEEVLSMAILLREAGAAFASITATDISQRALDKAAAAVYPVKGMELNEKNYKRFGGSRTLRDYYSVQGNAATFDPDLLQSVSFLKHDLVTGAAFGKFDLILCRNVMIYFNQELQNEVLKKFHKSLSPRGCLAIGSKESLVWCDISSKFAAAHGDEKIYAKIRE